MRAVDAHRGPDLVGRQPVRELVLELDAQPAIDLGGVDGAADTIVLNATGGDDAIVVTNNNGVITVSGLGQEVTITGFEAKKAGERVGQASSAPSHSETGRVGSRTKASSERARNLMV